MTITISFKDTEIDLYNYIKSKRGYSNFLKDLIERAKDEEEGLKPSNEIIKRPAATPKVEEIEVDDVLGTLI